MNELEDFEKQPSGQPPEETPGSYGAGIAGAFLGALVGVLPMLVVGFLGVISGWLGFLTAFVSMKGYQFFHGRRDTGFAFAVTLICSVVLTAGASILLFSTYLQVAGPEDAQFMAFLLLPIVFSVIGSLVFRPRLRAYTEPELLRNAMERARRENASEEAQQRVLYCPEKGWMYYLRISMLLSIFPELIFAIVVVFIGAENNGLMWVFGSMGALVAVIAITFALIPVIKLLRYDNWMFAREETGTLWRIHFGRLNTIDNYRFTVKTSNFVILNWRRLNADEQEMARASIFRAIADLSSGTLYPGSAVSTAVVPLRDIELVKENRWRWKVRYRMNNGRLKTMNIAKAYGGLCPVYGTQAPEGPAPFRLSICLVALVVTLALTAAAGAFGCYLDGGFGSVELPSSDKSGPVTASVPSSTTTYELDNITYQVDSEFRPQGNNSYLDREKGAIYTVSVQHNIDEETALDVLLAPLSTARSHPNYEGFRFERTEAEGTLTELTAANGETYLYNILSIHYTNGRTEHTAVALTDGGTLAVVTASHTQEEDRNAVKADMLFILESVEVQLSEEKYAIPAGAEVTEENYQSLFHLAEEMGYEYIGAAYLKAPAEMYSLEGDSVFVDGYIPYGTDLEYLDGGYAVQSTAHGMRVRLTTAYSEEDAVAVVEQAYQDLIDAGADIYEEGVFDTQYSADYDIACKQVAFFEENGTKARIAVLYADVRQNGYYLTAQITYLPDQFDEEYPALLKELNDVFGLTLPELPAF